jgi:hypothetical protein
MRRGLPCARVTSGTPSNRILLMRFPSPSTISRPNGRVRSMDEPRLSAEDVAAVIETYERLRTHAGLSQEEAKRETLESFANRPTYERYLAEGLSEDEALWQTWKSRHKDE